MKKELTSRECLFKGDVATDEPVVIVLAVLNFIFGGVCGGVSGR